MHNITSKVLLLIKMGSTFSGLKAQEGDFENWFDCKLIGADMRILHHDAQDDSPLPSVKSLSGIVLTGSSAMVTDRAPWSERLRPWLQEAAEAGLPMLGVCYGHQLLADTFGGYVAPRLQGVEIGTTTITCEPAASTDLLFSNLPPQFTAQTVHWQSVVDLPPHAIRLAQSENDPNHAFRIGDRIWGIQFHPEFSTTAMLYYLEYYATQIASEGLDPENLIRSVSPTPEASQILPKFSHICSIFSRHNSAHL